MFDQLSERLDGILSKIKGRGYLTEKDVDEGLREVRLALLEADVHFKVVKDFIAKVREKAIGQKVLESLNPGHQIVKIVHEELIETLGGEYVPLNLKKSHPDVFMLVGLQGSGKTTTCAKIALYLKKQNIKPYLVPADIYRPAAIDQLVKLAKDVEVPYFHSSTDMDVLDICTNSIKEAKDIGCDVVIIDTAGRLHIDEELMKELEDIKARCSPSEILLVVDAMTGQDAVNVATSFNERLDITGVILTKLEGDARGGAALSIRAVTQKPIKLIGVGEKLEDLEPFHPERIASRILGMGDVLTLIEKAQEAFDEEEAKRLEEKFKKAEFDLEDFRDHLKKIKKLGSIEGLLKLIPGMGKLRAQLKNAQIPEKELIKTEAIINSMTKQERRNPEIIDFSRKKRIAKGSGTTVEDVNRLLKNFFQMKQMLKILGKNPGLLGMGGIPAGGLNERALRLKRKKEKKKRKKIKRKKK